MTTININKLLLEQVQDLLYRVTRWKGENHEVLTDLHDIKEAVKAVLAAPATAPAWHDAQQAEIESLRWTVKDALESLDNGMTADCRATLSSATKETP